jgi:capsular exopolysaccharide synthesis family protein
MEPHEYLRVIRRRWRLLAACVLVSGAIAWITTPANPTNENVTYTATHQLIRDSAALAPPAVASLSVFVKTGEVPRRVAERIGYTGEPALLAADVTLEPDDAVGTLGITVSGGSPKEAADKANAFAEETLGLLGEQAQSEQQEQLAQVNDQLTTLQAEIDDLDSQVSQAEERGTSSGVAEAQRDSALRQYGAALDQQQQLLNQPPPSAGYVTLQEALPELAAAEGAGFSAPQSRPARTLLAMIVGLLLGLGAVFVAERFDTRLNTREATEAGFRLPVVAEVPRTELPADTILSVVEPMSAAAESYRTLRSSLILMPAMAMGTSDQEDDSPQVILVTSPAPGDGKTTTVANLAVAFAEAGHSVLIMGCDFRRPEIHHYFGVDPRPGIADVLMTPGRDLTHVIRPTKVPGVKMAPSGSTLRSLGDVANAGRALVETARELADIVLIDTPPILATNDATELIPAVDAVVLVARVGRTSLDSAQRTHRLLDRLSAPAAGVVLVGVAGAESRYYSSYYTTVTPPERRGGLLRRSRPSALAGRIEPWHGISPDEAKRYTAAAHRAVGPRDPSAEPGSDDAQPVPTEGPPATETPRPPVGAERHPDFDKP